MKTHAAGSNGIGPLVRQYVHERNAARKAGDAAAPSSGDTVELSAAALARFEAWKAKHATSVAEPDPVPPGTEPPATEPPGTELPPTTDPIATEPLIPASFSILV
jgi:hypothetical protein